MKNNHSNPRIKMLRKGKIKGVGFFERIPLKIAGRIDGARNLPRECDGCWISPHLDREIRSYDEVSSRIWGQLQLEQETQYARLSVLADKIVHNNIKLQLAKDELENAISHEVTPDITRKYGENKLTDSQVATRRANEREKRLSVFKNNIATIQNQIHSDLDEFADISSKIIENNNSTKMICSRIKDHLYQRFNVYWNSALRKHPERDKMPAVPCIEVESRTEVIYMEPHTALLQKSKILKEIISADGKEQAI